MTPSKASSKGDTCSNLQQGWSLRSMHSHWQMIPNPQSSKCNQSTNMLKAKHQEIFIHTHVVPRTSNEGVIHVLLKITSFWFSRCFHHLHVCGFNLSTQIRPQGEDDTATQPWTHLWPSKGGLAKFQTRRFAQISALEFKTLSGRICDTIMYVKKWLWQTLSEQHQQHHDAAFFDHHT